MSPFQRVLLLNKSLFFLRFSCLLNYSQISLAMNGEPNAKRLATESVKIGTHDGTFHCDEVLACYLLKQLPRYKDAKIIRTRDMSTLDECDIVVDVGCIYDPKKHRYDHHQKGFTETMHSLMPEKPWVTKLSSAGLVYCHFGHEIISVLTGKDVKDPLVEKLFDKLYENYIEEVDGIDNGINVCDNPRYRITTNLSSRVKSLNPSWKLDSKDTDSIFPEAMKMVGEGFVERLKYFEEVWWPARQLLEEALDRRFEVHESGSVLEFSRGGFPWLQHLYDLEKERGIFGAIKFVLFTDLKEGWRVQAVNVSSDDFSLRLGLLKQWRGMKANPEILQEIPGFVFTHINGFIGGNKTRDGALDMAVRSLKAE